MDILRHLSGLARRGASDEPAATAETVARIADLSAGVEVPTSSSGLSFHLPIAVCPPIRSEGDRTPSPHSEGDGHSEIPRGSVSTDPLGSTSSEVPHAPYRISPTSNNELIPILETHSPIGDTPASLTEDQESDRPHQIESNSDSGSDSDGYADDGPTSGARHSVTYYNNDSMPSLQTVSDSSEDEDEMEDGGDSEFSDDESVDEDTDPRPRPPNSPGPMERFFQDMITINQDPPNHTFALGGHAEEYDPEDEEEEDEEDEWEDEDPPRARIQFANNANADPWVTEMVDMLLAGSSRSILTNDPARAEILLAALENVPVQLLRRYQALRSEPGNDTEGCPICHDDFLQDSLDALAEPQETQLAFNASGELSPHSSAGVTSALTPATILAFPCPGRHLFHHDCLTPWLARKTTCPSCRFDIDPHSLTLCINGYRSSKWRPPQVSSLSEWLDEEEAVKNGAPRRIPVPGKTPETETFPVLDPELASDAALFRLVQLFEHVGRRLMNTESGEVDVDPEVPSLEPAAGQGPVADAPRRPSPSTAFHSSRLIRTMPRLLDMGRVPMMNMQDATVEDIFTRALRMGRADMGGLFASAPNSPARPMMESDFGVDDDEVPPLES